MATEAQTSTNRGNAQKSTGPRTPEGKAVVARNAVKHGLLAQEVVIKGEDPGEFDLYREEMLAELRNLRRLREQDAAEAVGSVPVRAYLPGCEETPDGVTPNLAGARGLSCETNPICPALATQMPHPSTIPLFQDSIAAPAPAGQSCETNPIWVFSGRRDGRFGGGSGARAV